MPLYGLVSFCFLSGNMEIGNGYGVPGGGAYYSGPRTHTIISSKSNVEYLFIILNIFWIRLSFHVL